MQITATKFYGLKSEKSAAVLSLDPRRDNGALQRLARPLPRPLRCWKAISLPGHETHSPDYRADATFNELILWLRRQGVRPTKPLHTLRKMSGSLVVERHGLFAASATLRHSSSRHDYGAFSGLTPSRRLPAAGERDFPGRLKVLPFPSEQSN